MPQTKVNLNQQVAIAGMTAKLRPVDIITGVSQEVDDGLDFGDPVRISVYEDAGGVKVNKVNTTASQTKSIDGFVTYDSRPGGQIKNLQTVGVVRKGFIWVKAGWFSGAVAAGSTLVYDLSAGKFIAGNFQYDVSDAKYTNTATLAAGDIVCGGIVLWSAVTAAEATAGTKLLLVEVNLPGVQALTVA